MHRQPNLAVPSGRKNCGGPALGCPVQSLFWSRGSPWTVAPVNGPSVFVPVSPALVAVDFFSCHGKQSRRPSHLTISPASTPRPLLLFSVLHCYTGGCLACSRTALAHSSPPGTGGYCCSARCKSSLVYQICVLGASARGRSVTRGQRASLAKQGQEKTRYRYFNQSVIYPRVFPENPREAHPISHCQPACPPCRGFLGQKLRGQPAVPGRAFLAPADTSPPK